MRVLSLLAGGLAVAFLSVSDASAFTVKYKLADHPAGTESPPFDYGLRKDDGGGTLGNPEFFSFSTNGASVTMVYDSEGGPNGEGTAKISGQVYAQFDNGERSDNIPDENQTPIGDGLWELEYTYTGIIFDEATKQFYVPKYDENGDSFGSGIGTVTPNDQSSGEEIDLGTKSAKKKFSYDDEPGKVDFFFHLALGHRGAAEPFPFGGAGWVGGDGTNDFLFTAQVVPLPAPVLLLGAALFGLGAAGYRKQRAA